MTGYTYTVFIILIPLVMFLVTGLLGMKWKPIVSGILGTIGMGTSWVLSLITAGSLFLWAPCRRISDHHSIRNEMVEIYGHLNYQNGDLA